MNQVDHAERNKINSLVAIMVAITATFMALCNVKDDNIVQAMSQAQATALNAWNYFEAKSIRQAMAENLLQMLKLLNPDTNAVIIKNFEVNIARHEKEKTKIKAAAESY